jgi:hypothetical protein
MLTNAVVPFDGDPIEIPDVSKITDVSIDHTLANADCTRVAMDNGDVFQVQESVEEIGEMISQENSK